MNKRLQLTFILLFISSLALMSIPVKSQSTGDIIISSDGSVTETPAIVQNGNTYTLTTNITENILVQKISDAPGIKVSNEMELNYAINNANGPTVIGLEKEITLTEQLVIPVNKDITLTSTSTSKFFKLIGGDTGRSTLGPAEYAQAVINVEGSGVLRIDGVFVTCGNYPLAWNKLVAC